MTKTRGRALIINNQKFAHSPERLGSNADVENLKYMLKELKFVVSLFENLSAKVQVIIFY